jgi:hypothetical protein
MALFDREAWELLYDFTVVADMAEHLERDATRAAQALHAANTMINVVDLADRTTWRAAREIASAFLSTRTGAGAHQLWACGHCFPEHDHQLLTNMGFMFLDELLGEGMQEADGVSRPGVERDAQGNVLPWRGVTLSAEGDGVLDWHGLEVATYNTATQCLEYRTPNALVLNKASADGVRLVEISQNRWPATDTNGVLLDKSFRANDCGVSLVCTTEHELYVRSGEKPGDFRKLTAQQLESMTHDRFSFRFMARAPFGVGPSAPDAFCSLVDTAGVERHPFDVSLRCVD